MSLDNYSKLAGEGRPEQTQQFRDMGVLAIEDAERAGIISPMEAVKRRRAFVSDVVETRVRRDILADPHAAEMALLNGQYEDLDPDERMTLVGKATAGVDRQERAADREENRAWQAQTRQWRVEDRATAAEDRRQRLLDRASSAAEAEERRRVAAEDRGYRLMERGERDLADKIQKEGDRLAATGELTPTWIERNRDNLDPEDYRHFYKQLEPETANLTTDPGIYASLRLRVAAGEDIRQDARIFMHHGDLAISEFDKLINEWESRAGGGASQRPGWGSQGETFIKNSLKVSDINPDPGAPQRLAQVLDQWSDWERANPGAKYEEAQKVYRQFVNDAAVVNFQQILSQTSAPTAAAIKTPSDLQAAEQRLVDEFSAKYGDDTTALMNDPEFLRRAEELEKLNNSMPQTAQSGEE
jgi:hypothetical protein